MRYVLKCLFCDNFVMDIFRNCLESRVNDGFFFVYDVEWDGFGIEVYLLIFGMKIIFKYRDFLIVFYFDFGWKYLLFS